MKKLAYPSTRVIFLIIALVIAVLIPIRINQLKSEPLQPPLAVGTATKPGISAGIPARLKIPKIGVDALVEPMGLTADGDMEAPSGAKTVGWYKFGITPGNKGSAVMDGHFGTWENGDKSVFDDLSKLVAGDSLIVEDDKGVVTKFIVRKLQTLGKDDDATAVFTSNDGKAHLNLITCQGDWIDSESTRSDRLVVFADRQ